MNAAMLPDGRRLHVQHGPIDLIIEAWGARTDVAAAYACAIARCNGLLEELVAELPALRAPLGAVVPFVIGPVARRMIAACWPLRDRALTPMAAVAGAVADHVLDAMIASAPLERAYVNDGGDIAVHLRPGTTLTCGVVADVRAPEITGTVVLSGDRPTRGIATSGAPTKGTGGRSFSLGIADAVTVLASSAAAADAAATVIANAVDLPHHPGIVRVPAVECDADSDLGRRLVTVRVPPLAEPEIERALDAGLRAAYELLRAKCIDGAIVFLQGRLRTCAAQLTPLTAEIPA